MTNTPKLGMTLMATNMASKEMVFNNALLLMDALFGRSVLSATTATPPSSPSDGDAYIVPASPTGAWAGRANAIAVYSSGWQFVSPPVNMELKAMDTSAYWTWNGTAWANTTGSVVPTNFKDMDDVSVAENSGNDGTFAMWDNGLGKWTNGREPYPVGWFFINPPYSGEVMLIHVAYRAWTLPASFTGSKGSCGVNPTSSFAMDVRKNGTSVGTITISTSGVVSFTAASSVTFAAGDVLEVVAPATADPTVAKCGFTLLGS
jgi:hypothetical protein